MSAPRFTFWPATFWPARFWPTRFWPLVAAMTNLTPMRVTLSGGDDGARYSGGLLADAGVTGGDA